MLLPCFMWPIFALTLWMYTVQVSGQACPEFWTLHNGHCYRHFNDPKTRVDYDGAQQRCKQNGGWLTDIRDQAELTFLGNLVRTAGKHRWADIPLVGLKKKGKDNPHNVIDNSTAYTNWCNSPGLAEPNNYMGNEDCIILLADASIYNVTAPDVTCFVDFDCKGSNEYWWGHTPNGYIRFVCKKPSPLVCDKPNTEAVNGACVCKKDYIDITATDVPEKNKFKPGEKCISKDPCKDAKDLHVNFLVDSSQSIGADNWDSLVRFLQSGAELLPNSTRVGFVKFSNNITFAKILAPGWSQSEYRRFVPSRFDKGETNTPAAFDKARAMFKKDKSRNQVAVLITDGLPFNGDLDEKEMLSITEKAAKKLRSIGVSLIALGYGEE